MMDNSARMGGARCLAAVPVVLLLCLVGFSHRLSTSSLFEELAGFIGRGLPGNGAPAPSPCPNTRVYGPPNTLHAALTNVDTYNFYPIEVPSSLDMDSNFCATSGHGRNAVDRWSLDLPHGTAGDVNLPAAVAEAGGILGGIRAVMGCVPDGGANVLSASSFTSAHFYNAVVVLMLTYFGCTPPYDGSCSGYDGSPSAQQAECAASELRSLASSGAPYIAANGTQYTGYSYRPWTCPTTPPCENNEEGCENPASLSTGPCFNGRSDVTGCYDFRALVHVHSSSFFPCKYENPNGLISGKGWTACAAALGLSDSRLWDSPNIQRGLSFLFNQNIPPSATAVGGGAEQPHPVAVGGPKDLSGAALASFSFGSGAICPNFAGCDQPGLTNSAIAATAIHALPKLAAGGTTHLMMQWETARAAADILGLATSSFEGDKGPDDYPSLAKSCTQWSTGEVCVWKVGDGGAYLGTSDVYSIMADKLAELGTSKLVQLAAPDHLPRVYRTGLYYLKDSPNEITLYPALIPYTHNYPATAHAALINLYEGSPFLIGPSYGLHSDNAQEWVRNRQIFRLYELFTHTWGGASNLKHVPEMGKCYDP